MVSTRTDNISRGCATKMEFPEGWGGPPCEPILENPEGMGGHRKNPFCGGGMDIFWNCTIVLQIDHHKSSVECQVIGLPTCIYGCITITF